MDTPNQAPEGGASGPGSLEYPARLRSLEFHAEARDLERVRKALAGEEASAEILVDRLMPIVQRRVGKTLRRRFTRIVRQDVEDLTQEILLLFFTGKKLLAQWQPERGLDLEAFVDVVTHRRALSKMGRAAAGFEELGLQEESGEPDPERRILDRSTFQALLLGLKRTLTPTSWRLFERRFIEQESVEEIAFRMEMDRGAVYARISRIRRTAHKIRDSLDKRFF